MSKKPGTILRGKHVVILLAVSIIALALPGAWTARLISLVQVIIPFQAAATAAADSIGDVMAGDDAPVSADDHRALQLRNQAMQHRLVALADRVTGLEREVEVLTATRQWSAGAGPIGPRGRLIPARIVTEDLLSWRSSRLINAGSLQGIRRGAGVVSRHFTIDRGEESGVRDGLAVLLGEVFVGVVEQVGTHTTRVKLLSDVASGMKVRIGRLDDEGFRSAEGYFWLVGRGGGLMEIRDVDRRAVEDGHILVGDIVLSDNMDDNLPAAMTIGTVDAIEPDRRNPLLSILSVQAAVEEDSLRRVYVYEPDTRAKATAAAAP